MVNIDIITYLSGYDYKVFERFIGSLNDTGFNGKIYVIINEIDKPIIKKLKKIYNNLYPYTDKIPKKTHINCHRFLCYKLLLENISFHSEYILICDSRDVLFQKNIEYYPFDKNVDIYGFLEGKTIENEQVFNARWIKMIEQLLKVNIYNSICFKNIICCGTTIGKLEKIKLYVNEMCHLITKYNIVNNLDQGLHNYLLHCNILDMNIKLLYNTDNLVNTVCNDIHKINENNLIVNQNNDVSYIVHQYDRFPMEFKQKISIKYDFTL